MLSRNVKINPKNIGINIKFEVPICKNEFRNINLTISQKEIERLKIIALIKDGELIVSTVAESFNFIERQFYCILKQNFDEGNSSII